MYVCILYKRTHEQNISLCVHCVYMCVSVFVCVNAQLAYKCASTVSQ